MNRGRWFYVLTLFVLLFSMVPVAGAREANAPLPIPQAQAWGTYTLTLPIPTVDVPPDVAPADVPGYYQAALYLRWTEVEAHLDALQRRGDVESYRLLPEANAFQIVGAEEACASLRSFGEVRADVPDVQKLTPVFKAQLAMAVQDTQSTEAMPVPRSSADIVESLGGPEVSQEAPEPQATSEPEGAEPEPDPDVPVYLVRLVTSDEVTPYAVESHLAWLETQGRILSYAWLSDVKAFKVTTESGLVTLANWPAVEAVVPFSEQTLAEARRAYREELAERASRAPQGVLAYTPTTPTVEVSLYGNRVEASSYTNTTTILTLRNGAGIEKASYKICPDWNDPTCDSTWWGGGGNWNCNAYLNSNIQPGDTLAVAQNGETPFSIAIPILTVDADLDTNTVTGQAPPDIVSTNVLTPPVLYTSIGWGSAYVTTTAAGAFVFSPNLDFGRGDYGVVRYYDAQGNQVEYDYYVPRVYVRESRTDNRVSGYVADPLSRVEVVLRQGGSIAATAVVTSSNAAWFSVYLEDPGTGDVIDIQAGDQVEVTCNGETMTVDVPPMTADADPDTDLVTGQAPPGITSTSAGMTHTLQVYVDDPSNASMNVTTTTPTGDYSADFSPYGGIDMGTVGYLRYINTEGHVVYLNFNAPTPPPVVYVRGYYERWWIDSYRAENHVGGYVKGFDGTGSVRLEDSIGVVKAEHTSVNASPNFSVYLEDCSDPAGCVNADIEPGDRVIATFGGKTTTVVVPNFDATVDVDNDTVMGNTDVDVVTDTYGVTRTLTVWPNTTYDYNDESNRPFQSVIPDGAGNFTAANPFTYWDWDSNTYTETVLDMAYGDVGHLRYIDADENRVYYRFQAPPGAPVIYVRGWGNNNAYHQDDTVGGYVPGFDSDIHGTGRVALLDSAGQVRVLRTDVWADPDFYVDFDVDIQAGDTVSATFGGKTAQVVVPGFDIVVDVERDEITGVVTGTTVTTETYGQKQTLTLWPNTSYDEQWSQWRPYQSVVPVSGEFTVANPFYYNNDTMTATLDLQYGMVGHLRYIDAEGNRVYLRFQPPPGAPVIYVRGWGNNNAYHQDDTVGGYVPGFDSDIHGRGRVALLDSAGQVRVLRTDIWADSDFYVDFDVDIQAGDTVSATFGGKTTQVVVPNFDVVVDVKRDEVTGVVTGTTVTTDTYGQKQTLTLWPNTTQDEQWSQWRPYQSVIPATGKFTAANPFYYDNDTMTTTLDLQYGMVGHLRYIDANGNRVYLRFQPPPGEPVVYVRGCHRNNEYEGPDYVGGYVPGFDSNYHGEGTVTLKDSAGEIKAENSSVWASDSFCVDLNVNVETGDTVVAEFGEHTTEIQVPRFDVTSDADADTVSGNTDVDVVTDTAGVTQTLAIWPRSTGDWGYGKHIIPGGNGDFTAANPFYEWADSSNVSVTLDILPGDLGHLRYIDADENRVYDAFRAPMFYVRGDSGDYEGDDYVRAEIDPGVNVTVTLERQGRVWATVQGKSDGNGAFGAYLTDMYGNAVYIQPGDEITFVFGDQTVSITAPALSASADAAADKVTGVGPADVVTTTWGMSHTLQVHIDSVGWTKNVTTTNAGAFMVTGTVNFGDSGWLRYLNSSGYYVYEDFHLPVIYARGDGDRYRAENYAAGYLNQANVQTTVNLKRGGATLATVKDMTNDNAWYAVAFEDLYGNAVNIADGDIVEVVAAGETMTMAVPVFDNLVSDPDADIVTGLTDASIVTDTMAAYGSGQTLSIWPNQLDDYTGSHSFPLKNVMPNTSGAFTATNPFYWSSWMGWMTTTLDINPNHTGHLRYIDGEGNYTYVRFQAEPIAPTFYIKGWYEREQGSDMFGNVYYYDEEYHEGDDFFGLRLDDECAAVGSNASVILRDSNDIVKARGTLGLSCYTRWDAYHSRGYTDWFPDVYGNEQSIAYGDTIEVLLAGKTYTYTVWDLYAGDVVQDAPGMVRGIAPGGITLDDPRNPYTDTPPSLWAETSWGDDTYLTTTMPATGTLMGNGTYVYTTTHDIYQHGGTFYLRFKDEKPNTTTPHTIWYRKNFAGVIQEPVVAVRGSYNNSAYAADHYVSGWFDGCADVNVVLKRDGSIKAEMSFSDCRDWGTYLIEASGSPANIKAGDTVEVTYDDQTIVVEVPAFNVTSDSVNDRLTGTTDAEVMTTTPGMTQTLAVWPGINSWGGTGDWARDWNYGKHVLPDAGGAFVATNPFYDDANPNSGSANLDWDPGQSGHLRYVNADGNRVYARFTALYPDPFIRVHKDGSYTEGWLTQSSGMVTVTLKQGDTVKAVAYDDVADDGYFNVNFFDINGAPVYIRQGDTVVVTGEKDNVTVPVPTLTGAANTTTDQVTGEGPADALLEVTADGTPQTVETGGDGAYTADFSGRENIDPGDEVNVNYRNDDGHDVYIIFYAGPKLNVQLHTYYAWGYAPTANTPVTLTLKDGTTVKGIAHTTSDNTNFFNAYFYNAVGQRAIIAGGDTIVAEFGDGSTATMEAAPLAATVDADADTVSGTGPADDKLGVRVDGFNATVETNNAGQWNADPGAQGEDIIPGEQVHIRHINTDRHETWLYAAPSVIYVRGRSALPYDYRADNYIRGHAAVRGATVEVILKRGTETVATDRIYLGRNDIGYSTYLYDDLGRNVDIQSGDQLIVKSPDAETLTVPVLDATVDVESNTVSGTGPADADLSVAVGTPWWEKGSKTVHTDARGVFTATFNTIDPGDYAYLLYLTPTGHWVHAAFPSEVEVKDAAIYARWEGWQLCNACASGWAGVANTVATVSLSREGVSLASETDLTDEEGEFDVMFSDSEGDPIAIANGDVIGVQAGGQAVSMTVAALTAQVNQDTGMLYGTGPARAPLYYWYSRGGWSISGNITIGPDGAYRAALGLNNNDRGYVRYIDDAGHRTYLGWASPHFGVQEYNNYVYGYTTINAPVDIHVLNALGENRAQASVTSDGGGYFNAHFKDAMGDPVVINPNDQVVFNTGTPVTVPVVPLDATVNVVTDTVTGTGPAGEDLGVDACGRGRNVTTDATDGSFTADFSDECDLQAGQNAWVSHYNDEHNRVYAEFIASRVQVNVTGDIVDGWVRRYVPVNLSLTRPDVTGTLATAATTAEANGFFSAFFEDAEGNTVDIQPGDTVEVTASPAMAVDVVAITATLNTANDTITGVGPADAVLRLGVYNRGGGGARFEFVETDAAGNFSVDFSEELDLTAESYAYIRYTDAQGHYVSYATTPPRATRLEDIEDVIQDRGASVVAEIFNVANDGDITPPLHYTGDAAERLIFASAEGDLILTYPDGSIVETGEDLFIIENAPAGLWKAQVDKTGGEGEQYAIAIGKSVEVKPETHDVYLPLVMRNAG